MAYRRSIHPIDPERSAPSHNNTARAALPPRPDVPFPTHTDTWRRSSGDDQSYRYPDTRSGWADDRYNQAGPSRPYQPGSSGDPYVPRAEYGQNAYTGSSFRPSETYRPHQQSAPTEQCRSYNSNRSSPPPTAGKYVPMHLRAPLTESRHPFLTSNISSSSPSHSRAMSPAKFEIPLPDKEYMELSAPFISHEDEEPGTLASKLLVLDLNGTLIYRNKTGSGGRTSYPRPYLGCFFKYIFRTLPDENQPRPWQVFVWSSAQPHNVRAMLESTFDPVHIDGLWEKELATGSMDMGEKGKVLGVWARDKMGLSEKEYAHKTQTTKDLRKVEANFESDTGFKRFPLETILLLDDSPLKAVYQPWNQLVLPEFDRPEFNASVQAVQSGDVSHPDTKCDQILLAVIGVLEATSTCENIPAWIRAGGLKKPEIQQCMGEDETERRREDPAWFGAPDGPAAGIAPSLEALPSHESFAHWFQDDKLLAQWVQKGKQTLESYGIPVEHGMDPAMISARSSPSPFLTRKAERRNAANLPGHSVPAERRRGYSPSRPSDSELPDDMSGLSVSPQPRGDYHHPRNVNGQLRSYTTHHGPTGLGQAGQEDTWRTFRSSDVSRWLAELSERRSLNEQDRGMILETGRLVQELGDIEDQSKIAGEASEDRIGGVIEGYREPNVDPFADADITDEFFGTAGGADGPRPTVSYSRPETVAQGDKEANDVDVGESEWAEEEPEPVNAQYPLDHPTSTFTLAPCRLRGNLLSKIEVARYFARAASNKDPVQVNYMKEIMSRDQSTRQTVERNAKRGKQSDITSSLRRMEKVRDWIIANEDIRDAKNARAAERRQEIKSYRDRGLEPPPPKPLPKSLRKQQSSKAKKKLQNAIPQPPAPAPKNTANKNNHDSNNHNRNHQHNNKNSTGSDNNNNGKGRGKKAKAKNHSNNNGQQRGAQPMHGNGAAAGSSRPGSSAAVRTDNKPVTKSEPHSKSTSSKRRASDAVGGAPVKVQRTN